MINRAQSLTPRAYERNKTNNMNLEISGFPSLGGEFGSNSYNFTLPNMANIESLTKEKDYN